MIVVEMGIQQVRLYTNTVSTVPTTFTDVTAQFSGINPNTVADETASATITIANLPSATTVFAWIEALDEAGNSSGIQPVGSAATTTVSYYVGYGADNTWVIATCSPNNNGSPSGLFANNAAFVFISGLGYPTWVQYRLPAPRKLLRYRVRARQDGLRRPSGWKILGSNDGVAFTLVHDVLLPTGTFIPAPSLQTLVTDAPDSDFYIGMVGSDVPYTFYRLEVNGQPSMPVSGVERLSINHWALAVES